jgi:hypothetical protein
VCGLSGLATLKLRRTWNTLPAGGAHAISAALNRKLGSWVLYFYRDLKFTHEHQSCNSPPKKLSGRRIKLSINFTLLNKWLNDILKICQLVHCYYSIKKFHTVSWFGSCYMTYSPKVKALKRFWSGVLEVAGLSA